MNQNPANRAPASRANERHHRSRTQLRAAKVGVAALLSTLAFAPAASPQEPPVILPQSFVFCTFAVSGQNFGAVFGTGEIVNLFPGAPDAVCVPDHARPTGP